MAGVLVLASGEGGNFNLSLADGGQLPVVTTTAAAGGVAAVTASLPLTSSGGSAPNIAVSNITGTAHAVVISEGSGVAFNFAGPASVGLPLVAQGGSADPIFTGLGVAGGGTGQTTLTAHAVLIGEGTSAIAQVGPDASTGKPLVSQGGSADPAFGNLAPGFITPSTWAEHAAGDAVSVAAQNAPQFFAIDTNATSGTQSLFNFPASGSAVDGQEVTITLEGAAVNTTVQLAPGTGNAMGDPNAAGQYGGTGATLTSANVGQVIRRKYAAASSKWRPF